MNRRTSLVVALLLAFAAQSLVPTRINAQSSPALPLTYYPVDLRAEFSMSLNGTWKFVLGPTDADYAKPGFDDATWKPIRVPGNWEIQGFADPKYGNPDDKQGFYRRTFTVPETWKERRTFIRFEGVGFAFEFFINGKRAGGFASSFNRSEFDITDFIDLGKPATIAVHVTCREKGWEFDTNDDWALSGIHRDVVLFSMPETHMKDYTVTTPLSNDGKQASVRLKTWVENFSKKPAQATVNAKVVDSKGASVSSLTKVVTLTGAGGVVEGDVSIANPLLWTAETPNLYRLDLELVVDGQIVHQFTQRVGLRQTTIEAGVLKLNGKPVKFRGITHHDIQPDAGRAVTREQYTQDIELMKAANINMVRTSHYPPGKVLLDLCDEYGMYVDDEVPFGFGDDHLTDDSYEGILALRAQATVARDRNQTSVMNWTIGNENPYTPMVVRTAGIVKALDPTRPRSLPGAVGKYYFPLPPELDLVDPHYMLSRPKDGQARRANTVYLEDINDRPDVTAPVFMSEYAHAAGTGMEMLKDSWEVMQYNDRFVGACIWEFHDQGLYRNVPAGTYPGLPKENNTAPVNIGTVKAGYWVAPDRVIDTAGQEGADGIVDGDRVPQSDYWAVQKIYSPVVIPVESLLIKAGRQTLKIPVQNRYDFTDLSTVSASWELRVDGHRSQGGRLTLQAAPRNQTSAEIVLDIPEKPAMHDQFLRFTFTDANRRQIAQHTVRLMAETPPANVYKGWTETPATAGGIKASEQGAVVTYTGGKSRLQVNKETGEVQFGVEGQPALAFDNIVLRVGREPQMSEIRAYSSAYWYPYLLTKPSVKAVKTSAPGNGQVKTDVTLQFTRLAAAGARGNVSDQGFIADIHLTLSEQGWLDVDYQLSPVNASDHLLELGLAFQLPKTSTRLTWLGKGPYSVYPIQAEGMERGVYTVAPRPDFDTANRMYAGARTEVDLASATDDAGNGLGIVCQSATVSLESDTAAAYFSHTVLSAGHGEKRTFSRVNINGPDLKPTGGNLRLVPLAGGQWPEPFKTVLSEPEVSPRIVGSRPRE